MPELPEVETVRRGLEPQLIGSVLRRVTLRRHDLRWPMPVSAIRRLTKRRVEKVTRRSKYLQLFFSGPGAPVALIHLGMSGRLFLDPPPAKPEWRTHEHWRMQFDSGLLRYVDARRFGMLDVVPAADLQTHPLIASLGPEPLGAEFDGEWLFRKTRRRRVAIKIFLMNAKEVVGIGNIYASEALFRAGVRPGRGAWRTTRAECHELAAAAQSVLREAIDLGGTTLRDYVGVDESSGYFQQKLAVYGRVDEPCLKCQTPIKRMVQGGRATYYCPLCQR